MDSHLYIREGRAALTKVPLRPSIPNKNPCRTPRAYIYRREMYTPECNTLPYGPRLAKRQAPGRDAYARPTLGSALLVWGSYVLINRDEGGRGGEGNGGCK